MSRKFTIEQTKKIFEAVGLELLETEARGIDYKYDCKDKEGYYYKRSAHTCQHTLKRKKSYIFDFSHTFSTKNPYFYKNMLYSILVSISDLKHITPHYKTDISSL